MQFRYRRRMHLEELEWFVALAEIEHVTEAAAALGVSQPTLSRALSRFETQVGTPLFDRVNRRLRLNPYGQIMLEHARRSIAEMQSAIDRIDALRDPDTGRVRLAFLHSLASWYVPEQLRRFRESAHRIAFDLFQGPAPEIAQRVLGGQADIAITSPRPRRPVLSGTDCTRSDCALRCHAGTGWRREPACACPRLPKSRLSRWRARPVCGSSPMSSGLRTAFTPTSSSRRQRSRRWKASSLRDSASPWCRCPATVVTPNRPRAAHEPRRQARGGSRVGPNQGAVAAGGRFATFLKAIHA